MKIKKELVKMMKNIYFTRNNSVRNNNKAIKQHPKKI